MVLALRDADLSTIATSLANANFLFVLPVSAALMLQFWFKALRWKILLQPFTPATTRQVFPATVIGYLANLVFPAYLGEFARVYLLGKQLRLRYSPVLATVVLERFFDFLSVLFAAFDLTEPYLEQWRAEGVIEKYERESLRE